MIIDLTASGNVSMVYLCGVKKAKAVEPEAVEVCEDKKEQGKEAPDSEVVLKHAA